MQTRKLAGEAVRFALVGCIATAVHYGTYLALLFALSPRWAYSVGYVVGFALNFVMTARFTFRRSPTWGRFLGMVGANIVNYLLHLSLLSLFLHLGIPRPWAPVPVFAIAVPVNFLLVRRVFTPRKK